MHDILQVLQYLSLNSNFRYWNSFTWTKTIQVNKKSTLLLKHNLTHIGGKNMPVLWPQVSDAKSQTTTKCLRKSYYRLKCHKLCEYAYKQCSSQVYVLATKETRNSSGDEIANVNFLYDDIVHALQNTIDWCINSATDRRVFHAVWGR